MAIPLLDTAPVDAATLLERVDFYRLDVARSLAEARRAELGQFLTPPATARFMASLFDAAPPHLRLLDAGAGAGALTAAVVAEVCGRERRPASLTVTAYEVDPLLAEYLAATLDACRRVCEAAGVLFAAELLQEDFIAAGVEQLQEVGTLFAAGTPAVFTSAILNPPYRKIHTQSPERQRLRRIGIETSNLYTGFLAIATRLLVPGGELVAITPRSFCNGPYFRPFRQDFFQRMALRRVHVYDSRSAAFRDDAVLQENIILAAVRRAPEESAPPAMVTISSSAGAEDETVWLRDVEAAAVVDPADANAVIHLVPDAVGEQVSERLRRFTATLPDLGLVVSTGRVVDFRAEEHLRADPSSDTVPLIYPAHCRAGGVVWPRPDGKKPNAIVSGPATANLLVPSETYVLVKRFSAKEERRRVTAFVYDPTRLPEAGRVGFENHLNYYHTGGHGLPPPLARGLAVYLNSTLVDQYVRQFSGHTQVNATDLRSLPYPDRATLERLGERVGERWPGQDEIDELLDEELACMADASPGPDPVAVARRIAEARAVLRALGLPTAQQNERSALTLLAVLDLPAAAPWSAASNPLRGTTQLMDWFAEHYGKRYAPNTRETVRRQTIHQFLDSGLLLINPDRPDRPINSGDTVYQIEPEALAVLRRYGSDEWEPALAAYAASRATLVERYAQERQMQRLPVRIDAATTVTLSPGGQNPLIKAIVEEFASRWTPGGEVLYVGDTDEKFAYVRPERFAELGITFVAGGKMPDVVIEHAAQGWLVLVEAVTSHGPINPKRRQELQQLFGAAGLRLVYVTAFLTRRVLAAYLADISWETEVWVAEAPSHLIHFDGERFLGPYPVSPPEP